MIRRRIGYGVWLALAACLYFFENDTGTRIVLLCTALLPLLPAVRRGLFSPDEEKKAVSSRFDQTLSAFAHQDAEEPGDVRAYLPGDPVNRIHWKLSAKRQELLIREKAREQDEEEAETDGRPGANLPPKEKKKEPHADGPDAGTRRWISFLFLAIMLLALALLLLLPEARRGVLALCNRLFDQSEAVNAYVYERFPVPADQMVTLAAALLGVEGVGALGLIALSGSRVLALILAAGCVGFQAYFGLSFPAWVHVGLLMLLCLWTLRRPWTRRAVLTALGAILALSLAVAVLWPGVDAATEAASEAVRDRLSPMAQTVSGAVQEPPSGENETRHVHTQTLMTGEGEAQADREYRLVTREEQPISLPHWVDYLRIVLLLLLTAVVVILPFLPFLYLNARRKRAQEMRRAFAAENVSEAVCAIFQQVVAWLEATGNSPGNLPYIQWADELPDHLPAGYADRFRLCAALFEEAAYSDHPLPEKRRKEVLELLDETERALWARADWKQKLRLKYKECLWV